MSPKRPDLSALKGEAVMPAEAKIRNDKELLCSAASSRTSSEVLKQQHPPCHSQRSCSPFYWPSVCLLTIHRHVATHHGRFFHSPLVKMVNG
jgi:hypothetical protein